MEFPAVPVVVAVTVTKFVLAVALTPTELPLPLRLMAAARFVATVDVLLLAAKVPIAPEQVVNPFEPVVACPQETPLVEVPDIAIGPGVVAVAVTVPWPPVEVADAPKLAGHALIAAAMP